jgi:hypothetical protein
MALNDNTEVVPDLAVYLLFPHLHKLNEEVKS